MSTDIFKKLKGRQLLLCSGALCLSIFLLSSFADFAIEGLARMSGRLVTASMSVDDFEKLSLVDTENGGIRATDGDPQLILTRDMKLCRVSFKFEFSTHPGEVVMYYAEKEGRGFSPKDRYWFYPSAEDETRYEANFRMKSIKSLRIDPTGVAGNEMSISEVTFNAPKAFFGYFSMDFAMAFKLLVCTLILASILSLGQEVLVKMSEKK